jgi:CBS domain-containing protein
MVMVTKMVRDVMQTDPLAVDASISINTAAHLMRASDRGDVFVTEHGKLRGVLTDRDIVIVAIAAGRHPATIAAGDCCNTDVASVSPDDPTERASALLREYELDRLPVVEDGQLVGSVSQVEIDLRSGLR